jgi:hypothetical protein
MKNEILQILEKADKSDSNIPPTLLYNEGWMLRIILQQIKDKEIIHEDLSFPDNSIDWFSEALLPSPFLARTRGDNLSESWTHADGVVGKFKIGKKDTGDLTLKDSCDFFYVTEAKMYSKLSTGTKNADNYNQAARNVACIAKLIYDNKTIQIEDFKKLAFYVLLPEEQIKIETTFKSFTDKDNMKATIKNRISHYPTDDIKKRDIFDWINSNLDYFMDRLDVKLITWEELVGKSKDSSIGDFYDKCKYYNKKIIKNWG